MLQDIPQNEITNKRSQFYVQIKTRSRQALITKIRFHNLQQELDYIIESIQRRSAPLTATHFAHLIDLYHKNSTNALLHLGNLAIDDAFPISEIRQEQLVYVNNEYFEWMVWVLIERGFEVRVQLLAQIATKTLVAGVQDFRITNALKCLHKSLKNRSLEFLQFVFLQTPYPHRIFAQLLEQCTGGRKLAWRILAQLFSQEQQNIQSAIVSTVGVDKLAKILNIGLLSVDQFIRSLVCQICTNIVKILSDQCQEFNSKFSSIWDNLLNKYVCQMQKTAVKTEISYLLTAIAETVRRDHLQWFIRNGIIQAIQSTSNNLSREAQQNNRLTFRILLQRLDQDNIAGEWMQAEQMEEQKMDEQFWIA